MWRIALLLTLLGVVTAKNNFPNEVVVTSADVVNGEIKNIGEAGETYRIYACVDADGDSEEFQIKKVNITDSTGKTLQLNDLRKAVNSVFLSDQNTVVGPISVRDPTGPIVNSENYLTNLPYTIYLVSTKVPPLPVAASMVMTANMPKFDSNEYNGQGVRGVTFLSGNRYLTLKEFTISADSAYIIPRGHDLQSSGTKDSVLDLNQNNAYLSYVTFFGPIATIVNTDQSKTGRIQFTYNSLSTFDSLKSGSSLTLLSPNWLSLDDSYSSPYKSYSEAFDRQFNYGTDTLLDFEISASSLKNDESVTVEIKDQMGKVTSWKYGPSDKGSISDSHYGLYFNLKVDVASPSSPSTYPRFIVKVTAGASSTLCLSLILSLVLFFW